MSDSPTQSIGDLALPKPRPVFWPVFWAAFLGVQAGLATCSGAAVLWTLGRAFLNAGTPTDQPTGLACVKSGMNGALDLYRAHVGTYPNSEDGGLQCLLTPPADPNLAARWLGPYVKSADDLLDPWGRPYHYRCPGEHHPESYDLWSDGRMLGPEDDITNW